MKIKIHNTLSGELEEFIPMEDGKIKMFVCGPTVYDFAHLGNAKTYTQFDFIARFFRYVGFDLNYLLNITDIDDKIIRRAAEKSITSEALARKYEEYYLEDMKSLNNLSVSQYARASDYIGQIVSQVKRLLEKGFAYQISDGYYFDISLFDDYGKLSGRSSLRPSDSVSRIDENEEKRNPGDFCLWKFKKEGEPSWNTEIGEGRPGWHIEDTAITESVFGPQYDVHGGAVDLIFPHHEAEITQMESVSGLKPFVRYWMHAGFLNVDAEKMSKSLGNFTIIRDVIARGFSPLSVRYLFLLSHYRTSSNFTWEALEAAENALKRLKKLTSSLPPGGGVNQEYKAKFIEKMSNDFNTPQAMAVLWGLVKDKEVSQEDKLATILDFDKVLGLGIR